MEDEKKTLPGKVLAIVIMMFVSAGILTISSIGYAIYILLYGALLAIGTYGFGLLLYLCLIFPILYIAWAIIEVVQAMKIIQWKPFEKPPLWVGIGEIIMGIFCMNVFILAIGIVNTVLMTQGDVKEHFSDKGSLDID